jgi:hypothetical protein
VFITISKIAPRACNVNIFNHAHFQSWTKIDKIFNVCVFKNIFDENVPSRIIFAEKY